MKAQAAFICLVLLTAACAAASPGPRSVAGDKLYEAVDGGHSPALAIIDSASKATERRLPLGVPSPDWKHVYSILGTSLIATDPQTGSLENSVQLGGSYHLPAATAAGVPGGLSPDGRWLVVESSGGQHTRMLVLDTTTFKVADRVDLTGDFEFDAISDGRTNLYVIQHLNAGTYHVRLYDVAARVLEPEVVVDKSDGDQAMVGRRLSGVVSPDHQWLFSIYVRDHQAPFIHALNLGGPFALCLDLPGAGYLDDPREMSWTLAMSTGEAKLYAVNSATGEVAVVSVGFNEAPSIMRTAHVRVAQAGGAVPGANLAVVDGDALIAGGPTGLVWINTPDLTPRISTIPGWQIASVGLSPDGKTVYAVNTEGRIAAVSAASGEVTAMFDPAAGTPMALMRVAAT
jgi:hypothetical protein